jgi:heme oxygenase
MTHVEPDSSPPADAVLPQGRAARVIEATRAQHEQAETRSFITALMAGELGLEEYSAYLAQYAHVYQALESRPPSDRELGPLEAPELARMEAIEGDLCALGVADWCDTHPALEATTEYVDRLLSLGTDEFPQYLAHHYTRYLGDLSGGQAIAVLMARHYGAADSQLGFYRFEGIDSPVRFKRAYRQAIDALEFTDAQDEDFIAEAKEAFRLNSALFDALDAHLGARAS